MRWSSDGRPCEPRDLHARLEQRIDPRVRHRLLVAWVLNGYKWKPDPQRFLRRPRPVWRGVDLSPS